MITIGRKESHLSADFHYIFTNEPVEFMKICCRFVLVSSAAFTALGARTPTPFKGDAIYLYCSASTIRHPEGIERSEDAENDMTRYSRIRPISFEMKSKQKHLQSSFPLQYNWRNSAKLPPGIPAKDQMEIVTNLEPCCGFIITFNPITLENKLVSFKTKEESWAWADSLKVTGKTNLPDRLNDPINGSGGTELRLIQVAPTTINRPLF